MSARAHSVILALHLMATRNQMQASLKWSRAFILVSMSMIPLLPHISSGEHSCSLYSVIGAV
jgi:hypothetical protein